jgi:hypothetical protein
MLSPGKYHRLVPKEPEANHRFRSDLLRAAEKSLRMQAALRKMCQVDILFFINAFVWQINFLKKDEEQPGPFITHEFQDRVILKEPGVHWKGEPAEGLNEAGMLWCMENDQSLLIEKSREMGASWLCLIVLDWRFLFHRWVKFLCISRSEEAVEKAGDSDALFWKLDWIHRHLPKWLLPSHGVRRGRRYFGNKDLGSSITGQASTGLAGVGGRATAMFIDEFSVIREDTEVRAFTANYTNCRIFNGTHRGLDTEMYRLSKQPEIKKLTIHWTQDPAKRRGLYRSASKIDVLDKQHEYPLDFNFDRTGKPVGGPHPGLRSPYYDRKCIEIGNEAKIAMDMDINPERSVSTFFDSMLIDQLIREYCQPPWWEGDLEYERDTGKPVKLIQKTGGRIKLWCALDMSGKPPCDRYGAGGDFSTGTGASNTCLSIASCTTGEKVCEVADPALGPVDAAEFFVALLRLFLDKHEDPPLFGFEITGPGAKFKIRAVDELKYKNVYRRIDDYSAGAVESDKIGFDASTKQQRPLLDDYASSLRRHEFLNRSKIAMQECLAWKYDEKGIPRWSGQIADDPSGARENHGDRSVADMICNRMIRNLGLGGEIAPKKEKPPVILSPEWRYKRVEDMLRNKDDVWEE